MSMIDHQQRELERTMQVISELILGREDGACCVCRQESKSSKGRRAWRAHASQGGHSGSSQTSVTEPISRTQSESSSQATRPKSSKSFLIPLLTATFLSTPASAAPAPTHTAALHVRQSIPDQAGRTGNDPAPVKPDVPPRPLPLSSSTPIVLPTGTGLPTTSVSISSLTSTSTLTSTSFLTSTISTTSSTTTSSTPQTTTSPPPLQPLEPPSPISAAAISGIAIGSTSFLVLIIIVILLCHKARQHSHIAEIPRRASSFPWSRRGPPDPHSHSPTSSYGRTTPVFAGAGERKKSGRGVLRKSGISHPRPAMASPEGIEWLEKPRSVALSDRGGIVVGEGGGREGSGVSRPPARPVNSAEPLGRLSGMGLGMGLGYLR